MSSVYLVHSIAGLQSNLYSTYSTEDKFEILAVEVLTHLLDTSDLKWKISHFHQQYYCSNLDSHHEVITATNPEVWPPLINSHSFMQKLTNQKSRTVSSWLLIGLNLHKRMWINQKWSNWPKSWANPVGKTQFGEHAKSILL